MVNIKIVLKRIWCEGVNWVHVARDTIQRQAFVIAIMKLLVPLKEGNFVDCVSKRVYRSRICGTFIRIMDFRSDRRNRNVHFLKSIKPKNHGISNGHLANVFHIQCTLLDHNIQSLNRTQHSSLDQDIHQQLYKKNAFIANKNVLIACICSHVVRLVPSPKFPHC
jgi:hypothetical protein